MGMCLGRWLCTCGKCNGKPKTIMIDPPSGWKYGFPKELPHNVGDVRQWLINNGYPEKDVDFAMKHCRQWFKENEEE